MMQSLLRFNSRLKWHVAKQIEGNSVRKRETQSIWASTFSERPLGVRERKHCYKCKQRNMTNHLDTVIFFFFFCHFLFKKANDLSKTSILRHFPKVHETSAWRHCKWVIMGFPARSSGKLRKSVNHKSKLKMELTRRREGGAEVKSHVYSRCVKMLTLLKSQTHPTSSIKLDSGTCSDRHQLSDTRKDILSWNLCVLTF